MIKRSIVAVPPRILARTRDGKRFLVTQGMSYQKKHSILNFANQ
jgi:hypothetical protein